MKYKGHPSGVTYQHPLPDPTYLNHYAGGSLTFSTTSHIQDLHQQPSFKKSRYFWPDMDRSIQTWAKGFLQCQQHKISRHTKAETTPFSLPSGRFETVHIDIIGLLPPTTTYDGVYTSPARYVLTCIDRVTRWVEATPLQNTSASIIALAFLNRWISRFGVPLHVVTDQGSQFESELFGDLSAIIGFHRLRITAYHPQTNGIIERLHRTLKTAIMVRKQSWLYALPIVLLGIGNMPNDQGFFPSRRSYRNPTTTAKTHNGQRGSGCTWR